MPNIRKTGKTYSFIIEELDPETMCVLNIAEFEVDDLELLGFEPDQSQHKGIPVYDIDMTEVAHLKKQFNLENLTGLRSGVLRPKIKSDDLSFPMHAGRELLLMLQNKKPMAFFSAYETVTFADICPQPFDKYVACGQLTFREFTFYSSKPRTLNSNGVRYFIYTLPDEEWRADAFILLKQLSKNAGWSEGYERLECALLGYTENEIEEYIAKIYCVAGPI